MRVLLRSIMVLALSVLAVMGVSGSADAQSGEDSRFDTFKRDVSGFFGGSSGQSQRRGEQRVAQSGDSELVLRLERIENQMRQLTGLLEQMQFKNQQLEGQLRRMQEDVEFRFQESGGKVGARTNQPVRQGNLEGPGAGQGNGSINQAPGGRRADAFDPNQDPNAPGAPRVLGGIRQNPGRVQNEVRPGGDRIVQSEVRVIEERAPGNRVNSEVRVQSDLDDEDERPGSGPRREAPLDIGVLAQRSANEVPRSGDVQRGGIQRNDVQRSDVARAGNVDRGAGDAGRGQGDTIRTANQQELPPPPPRNPNGTGVREVSVNSGNPRDQYDAAFGNLQRKDYAAAETGFREFLKKNPADRLAPDAHYWLGESLFQKKSYKDAAESFLTVSTKYDSTVKAPDALLRLSQSLSALGEKEASCATLNRIGQKYPRAAASVKQGVEREQKRVGC